LLADPVRARAIGEAGRVFVKQEFRMETMVERTAELYHQVLESWQPAPQEAK
jgi:hypothetical protein